MELRFDAVNIDQVEYTADIAPHVDTIEIDPYCRVLDGDEVVLTHASDKHDGRLDSACSTCCFKSNTTRGKRCSKGNTACNKKKKDCNRNNFFHKVLQII